MTGSRSGFHLPVRTGSGSSLPVQVRQNRPVHVLNEQAGGALSRTTEGATPFAFFSKGADFAVCHCLVGGKTIALISFSDKRSLRNRAVGSYYEQLYR